MKRDLEFRLKNDLDGTLSEIEKRDGVLLPGEFKDAVRVLDGLIGRAEDLEEADIYFRALLTLAMFWTAKKIRSWSEELTKKVEDRRLKTAHKLSNLLLYTIEYIREIIYLSDRCIELILGKD